MLCLWPCAHVHPSDVDRSEQTWIVLHLPLEACFSILLLFWEVLVRSLHLCPLFSKSNLSAVWVSKTCLCGDRSWAGDSPGMDLALQACHPGYQHARTSACTLWLVPQRPQPPCTKLSKGSIYFCFIAKHINFDMRFVGYYFLLIRDSKSEFSKLGHNIPIVPF